jgi:hypothetical protein
VEDLRRRSVDDFRFSCSICSAVRLKSIDFRRLECGGEWIVVEVGLVDGADK